MKMKYEELEMEIIEFHAEDVISTSEFNNGGQQGDYCEEDYDICFEHTN